jgi:hypothetical protein
MPPQDAPRQDKPSPYRGVWRVPREPDRDGAVRAAFVAVAQDRWFWVVARLIPAHALGDDLEQLRSRYPRLAQFLTEVEQLDFRYAFWDQGGWADFEDRQPGRIILALSRWALLRVWRSATASHELLHLARHLRGITPFGVRPSWHRRWREELQLFVLGTAYAPLSWIALLMLPLVPGLILFAVLGLLAVR